MPKRSNAYVAAVSLDSLPELRELLCGFTGADEKRDNVVMVRLSDDAARYLDQLVEAGLSGSRSEAAAFLIGTGIDANAELLSQVAQHSGEIKKIRDRLRKAIVGSLRKPAQNKRRSKNRSSLGASRSK